MKRSQFAKSKCFSTKIVDGAASKRTCRTSAQSVLKKRKGKDEHKYNWKITPA